MNDFSFRLEKILHLREQEEKMAIHKLFTSQSRLASARQDLARAEAVKLNYMCDYRRALQRRDVDPDALRHHSRYSGALSEELQVATEKVRECEREVKQMQALVVSARQRRETLEKLRERELNSWLLEQRKREQKQTDEVGNARWREKECGNGS